MTQLARELDLVEQCRAAVARLYERHAWSLLDRTTWAALACAHLRNGTAADPGSAAFYTYSEALYRACSGHEGAQHQEHGYTELAHFLYHLASRRYPDVSADATQLALYKIYRSFEQCAQPGWFFAFAKHKLMDAAKTLRLHEQHHQARIGQRLDSDTLRDSLADPAQLDLSAGIVDDEDRQILMRYRAEFLRKHPRAARQLDAVWLKYIDGLNDSEISQRLCVAISDVYTLRCRGIKKLKAEPGWRALAAEFGIFADEC